MNSDADKLASWILCKVDGPITALKLQKLMFYCFGSAIAHGHDVGDVAFHAWKHGPVCVPIYERFKSHGAAELPRPEGHAEYPPSATEVLLDTLSVYQRLSAWQIREESHLEAPWASVWKRYEDADADARKAYVGTIDRRSILEHFKKKFAPGKVSPPALLSTTASLRLDGIPVAPYASLHALAKSFR